VISKSVYGNNNMQRGLAMSHVRKVELLLEVDVEWNVLPQEEMFPEELDIVGVYVTLKHPTSGAAYRKVNIVKALSEGEIINLEDQLWEES
jgi:hypothetical protein